MCVLVYDRARNSTKLQCFSPAHLRVPACSSSWPEVASAPPAARPTSAARCSAAPAAVAPQAPLALVSVAKRKVNNKQKEWCSIQKDSLNEHKVSVKKKKKKALHTSLALFLWMTSRLSLWYCSILTLVFSTSMLFVRLYTTRRKQQKKKT